MRLIDLTGKKYGKYTVIRRGEKKNPKKTHWICRCVCGVEKSIDASNLKNRNVTSCGCDKHGMTNTITYTSWAAMKSRCNNSKYNCYEHYGKRGIKVCARWSDSFTDFLADMGERPSLDYSIDRIDVNGNYEPGNCRWATRSQQRRNQREGMRGHRVEFRGKVMCLDMWAKEIGIKSRTLTSRFRKGWSVEKALTAPLMQGRSRGGIASQASRRGRNGGQ